MREGIVLEGVDLTDELAAVAIIYVAIIYVGKHAEQEEAGGGCDEKESCRFDTQLPGEEEGERDRSR
jgi:hypothetical protein